MLNGNSTSCGLRFFPIVIDFEEVFDRITVFGKEDHILRKRIRGHIVAVQIPLDSNDLQKGLSVTGRGITKATH